MPNPTVEDDGRDLLTRTSSPEFTVARALGKTALYKRGTPQADWTLVVVEDGDAQTTLTALAATGVTPAVVNDIAHLLVEGDQFPATIATFASPTAVSVLRAEIALLRKRAEEKRLDAGMSGEWGDRGASRLDATADAYEHAIKVFETYPTSTTTGTLAR